MHVAFVFSSMQSYLPFAISIFFLFTVCVGSALPYTPVEFSTGQPLLQAFPSPSTLGEVLPLLPSLASLFIYSLPDGVPLPHSPELGRPALFDMCLFFFSCLFSIQFFFPLGGGQSVQGAMLI
jgi:hypothetical protein